MKVTTFAVMSLSTRKLCAFIGSKDSARREIENVSTCMCIRLKSYQPVDISCKKVTVRKELTVFIGIYYQQMIEELKPALTLNSDSAN